MNEHIEAAAVERSDLKLDLNPFFFPGNKIGVLLIHGFTGSPPEMRGMGEYLATQGLTVLGVRLAGHGTTPEDLACTSWHDWVASCEDGLRQLRTRCETVFVGGLSMGGVLTLHLAAHHPIAGAIVMAAPIYLTGDWRIIFVPVLQHIIRWYVPKGAPDARELLVSQRIWSYDRIPGRAIGHLFTLMKQTRRLLPRITVPILIMQGLHDRTVPVDCAQEIYERVGSRDKQLLWFPESGHILPQDVEREAVWQRAYEFIMAHAPTP